MTKNESLSSNGWTQEDLAFAVAELGREFLNTKSDRLAAAVDSAASLVLSQEGRVRLLQAARRFMRTH
jgi:hypothetical protein